MLFLASRPVELHHRPDPGRRRRHLAPPGRHRHRAGRAVRALQRLALQPSGCADRRVLEAVRVAAMPSGASSRCGLAVQAIASTSSTCTCIRRPSVAGSVAAAADHGVAVRSSASARRLARRPYRARRSRGGRSVARTADRCTVELDMVATGRWRRLRSRQVLPIETACSTPNATEDRRTAAASTVRLVARSRSSTTTSCAGATCAVGHRASRLGARPPDAASPSVDGLAPADKPAARSRRRQVDGAPTRRVSRRCRPTAERTDPVHGQPRADRRPRADPSCSRPTPTSTGEPARAPASTRAGTA